MRFLTTNLRSNSIFRRSQKEPQTKPQNRFKEKILFKKFPIRGAWVDQCVKASAFGSGHDPRVLGLSPMSGSLLSGEPASTSLSACSLPIGDLCLSNK